MLYLILCRIQQRLGELELYCSHDVHFPDVWKYETLFYFHIIIGHLIFLLRIFYSSFPFTGWVISPSLVSAFEFFRFSTDSLLEDRQGFSYVVFSACWFFSFGMQRIFTLMYLYFCLLILTIILCVPRAF